MTPSSRPRAPWTVRTQLLAAFLTMAGVIALVTLLAFASLAKVDAAIERIDGRLFPQAMRLNGADAQLLRMSLEARHAMLARDAQERDAALERIAKAGRQLTAKLDAFESAITTDQGRKRFADVKRHRDAFLAAAGPLLAAIQAGDTAAGMELLITRVAPARDAFLAALDHQDDWQAELVVSTSAEVKWNVAKVEAMLAACLTLCLLLGGGLGLWLSRRFARALGGEPHEAVAAMRAIAAGDLATPPAARGGDADSVMATLGEMRTSLVGLVADVRRSVDGVTTAAHQIAAGNADLSSRTESQASDVQQAASAMVQMTESVRANADSAREATAITTGATAAAARGGEVVRQVVDTMDAIQGASRRIADITATIDGIAFQTNILALNAAVEAARAGEQGRGFAVVAAEVRTLAQRSAAAAREVKALIADSVDKVDAGHGLVTQAGDAMREIVTQVGRVDALIGQIAGATDEQARGVAAVGGTVQSIDGATQQNAALVEQSAAAAESLRRQAEQLQRAVGVFRTEGVAVAA